MHNFTFVITPRKKDIAFIGMRQKVFLTWKTLRRFNYFQNVLAMNPTIKTLIIWSDGCLYQNKNNCLAKCLLPDGSRSECHNNSEVLILVVGHTQMECDNTHATIERNKTKRDIHSP